MRIGQGVRTGSGASPMSYRHNFLVFTKLVANLHTWQRKLVAISASPLATSTGSCQILDLTKFHMVKDIDNAFAHMELCLVSQAEVLNWLLLPHH